MNAILEQAFPFVAGGLALIIMAALVALPVALLALVIDLTCGKWFTARVRCWLWVLVAVRLVLPIAPESPVSAVQMWEMIRWTEQVAPAEQAATNVPEFLAQESAQSSLGKVQSSMGEVLTDGRQSLLFDLAAEVSQEWEAMWSAESSALTSSEDANAISMPMNGEEIFLVTMLGVWVVGVGVVLLRAVLASLRFAWRLRSIPEAEDPSTIDIVLRVCDQLGVRRPRVKRIPGLATPALFGIWRPTLCLPADARESLTADQLRMIVLHEAMHVRRGDGYLAWLLTLVQAFHWFNPVAWFTIHKVKTYRELACDDAVRQFTRPEERPIYADLLLRFAAGRSATSLGLLGLCFARPTNGKRKGVAGRIAAFASQEELPRRMPRLVSLILVLLLAVVGLTDAADDRTDLVTEQPESLVFSLSDASAWEVLEARSQGEKEIADSKVVETREYDLTEALAKVDDVPSNMAAQDWLLLWVKHPSAGATITPVEDKPNHVSISMPRSRHAFLTTMLAEVCRAGHVGQVVVTTRVMSSEHVEKLIDADWLGTIKYAAPEPVSSAQWAQNASHEEGRAFSLSMESVSFEYAPYTAFVIDEEKMGKLVRYFTSNQETSLISAPKVTLFSGQVAQVSDESLRPFVYGVKSIEGTQATALQPSIAVLPEGLQLDVQTLVLEENLVNLRCRLTLSSIDGVAEAKLPGGKVTVQTPKATRRTVNVCCQLKRGETLLVAPIAGQRSDGKKTHYYAISAEEILEQEQASES